MIIFKSIYGESLMNFPYTDSSLITITTEENNENNKYHSLEWNTNYFFDLLLNEVPKAVNVLFITPDFWLIPDVKNTHETRKQLDFWEQVRTHRNAFVTKKYAETANDTINLFIDRCIRNRITSRNATMYDLAMILFAQEILAAVINTRFIHFPLLAIQKEIEMCKDKYEMTSKIIGRQNIVDGSVKSGNLLKHVNGFTKNQINKLRKEVLTYDG